MHEPHLLAGWILGLGLLANTAPAQDQAATPQAVLEHAHYVEAHEHDLVAAKAGYEQALAAARDLGQSEVASQAERALQRVRVRLGEIEAPAQEELPQDLFQLFSLAAGIALDDGRALTLSGDMALYGDRATPILAEWLALPKGAQSVLLTTPQRIVVANPYFAAQALGVLGTPMARAALLGGLDSPDPLLRRTVISSARHDHGALFAKAIDDPIDALRVRAADRLVTCDDPSIAPALATLVRRGRVGAASKLAALDPLRALDLVDDATLEPGIVQELESGLRGRSWNDLQPSHVETFFAAASSSVDSRRRRLVVNTLPGMIHTRYIEDARDPAALMAAFDRALTSASPDLQVRYGWVLGPARAETLLLQYLASDTDVLTEEEDERVEGLARYCIERSSDPAALAERLFAPALARSEFVRIASARPGQAYSNECAATVLFAHAIQTADTTGAGDARFLRLFESIPEGARPAFHQHVSNWVSNRVPRDPNLFGPGTLGPRFVAVAVALMQSDDSAGGHWATTIARAVGTVEAVEELIARTRFPYNSTNQVLRMLAQGFDAESSARIGQSVIAALRPIASDVTPNRRATELIQFGLELGGSSKRDFLLAVWALPLSEQLRSQTYYDFAQWQNSEEVLPTLLELYPSLPESAGGARTAAITRFGTNLYEPAIDLLGEALRDRDLSVRTAAQDAFQRFREHREALEEYEAWRQASDDARDTVAQLVALLASEDRDVVRGAVEALGAVKARTALPQLVALLGRDDAELKAAVTKAIAAIGG